MLLGPLAKIEAAVIPDRPNVHLLGAKPYAELPAYLSHWDVAMLPFARNDATRFISPTKTPEYLAAGRPVVSTSIPDVVTPYGELGLVHIADDPDAFVAASRRTRRVDREAWLSGVDGYLAGRSWEATFAAMRQRLDALVARRRDELIETEMRGDRTTSPPVPRASMVSSSRARPVKFDYLIVGAGFCGSTLAERLARAGKHVLVVDRRQHIGGNAYDHYNDDGLLVHRYGPHIFHTNSKDVFEYLSMFTAWRPYEHRVRASVNGQLVPIPINLDTINALYGTRLTSFEVEGFLRERAESRSPIATSEDVIISKVGRELYELFFKHYTRKQWGLDPSELDAQVIARIPVRTNRDDRYFSDTYQAMPLHGYTRMFQRMLDHPRIKVLLNTDYAEIEDAIPFNEMIYTGPIDEFFDYRFGRLPYRSLRFEHVTVNEAQAQPVAVLNFPESARLHPGDGVQASDRADSPTQQPGLRVPDRRRRPVLSDPDRAERRAVQALSGACARDAGRPLCGPSGHLQVLQHGSGDGPGAHALSQALRNPFGAGRLAPPRPRSRVPRTGDRTSHKRRYRELVGPSIMSHPATIVDLAAATRRERGRAGVVKTTSLLSLRGLGVGSNQFRRRSASTDNCWRAPPCTHQAGRDRGLVPVAQRVWLACGPRFTGCRKKDTGAVRNLWTTPRDRLGSSHRPPLRSASLRRTGPRLSDDLLNIERVSPSDGLRRCKQPLAFVLHFGALRQIDGHDTEPALQRDPDE